MTAVFRAAVARFRSYWTLLKSLQSTLLLVTGLAGYLSARCPVTTWQTVVALCGSLFLAIAGSTVLNMVYDRDIDQKMGRTCRRPLPVGLVSVREALALGLLLAIGGVAWAAAMSPLYGLVVFAGLFFDAVIYTMWLKRRTPWSIIWGGLAGGMPILAGRVLATGAIDIAGLVLALAVLFWIPTHIVTFSIKYAFDYRAAGVPVFPNTHGERTARLIISFSTAAAVLTMLLGSWLVGVRWGYLQAFLALGIVLLGFAAATLMRRSPRLDFGLFKLASVYMLASSVVLVVGV